MFRKGTTVLAVAAALGAVTLGYVGAEYYPIQRAHAAPAATVATAAPVASPASRSLPDFTSLVETQGPAVVHISATQRAVGAGATRDLPFKPGDPMYEFFRRFQMPTPDAQPMPRQGQGSGFVISARRLHPHQRARRRRRRRGHGQAHRPARVQGQGGRHRPADRRRGGEDRREGPADRASSATPSTAQGRRMGGRRSARRSASRTPSPPASSAPSRARCPTTATCRSSRPTSRSTPATPAGRCSTWRARSIGINSQIYSRTGGYMGLSFAIPIDVAVKVKDDLVKYGKVSRGRIGVTIQDVNKDLAESFGLDRPRGALVSAVEPGSPADKAGLKAGDVILVGRRQADRPVGRPAPHRRRDEAGHHTRPPGVAQGRDAEPERDRRRHAGREGGGRAGGSRRGEAGEARRRGAAPDRRTSARRAGSTPAWSSSRSTARRRRPASGRATSSSPSAPRRSRTPSS